MKISVPVEEEVIILSITQIVKQIFISYKI
jgi:hypothetical protein